MRTHQLTPALLHAARDERGITTIEFALIAPVFLLLMMGIVEFSMIMFTSVAIESATFSTSRTGKTGYVATGSSREEQIIASVRNRTEGLLDPNLITLTTKVYSSFANIDEPEPYIDSNHNGVYNSGETYSDVNGNGQWDEDMASAGLGNANDIVVYSVSYPWSVMTPIVRNVIGNTFVITSRMVVKNEPYTIQE